ncbi:site-2 protease family protein [Catellatospora chokoriensis]|uniref:Peptidase M50 domain-containing protein n=1 Tax=Catellatospora chokoriensis TaxID=310353 RepID=A0A8J3K0I7_9ACTN|nr:site-2 protease family protein [Catellatospora chokoriensis]GIF94442.1 hypothetical protein Cch02nite_78860 [Catellatospora chokoriensis]
MTDGEHGTGTDGTRAPGADAPGEVAAVQAAVVSPGGRLKKTAGKVGTGLVAAGGLAKLGSKVLLLGKGLGVLLKFKTAGSMLLSVLFYALHWGLPFAVGFVLLLFVHEMGHVVALRAQGVRASAPMFIPGFGAFVTVEGEQRSVVDEALSSLAGPVAGVCGVLAVYGLSDLTGSTMLRALAYTGFLLNLFNLLPMLPLDGGRVAGALHPRIWFAGLIGAAVLLYFMPSPVLVFVLVLGGIETVARWRDRRAGRQDAYFDVPARRRWQIGLAYVAVAAVCLVGMHYAYVPDPR